ncbi:MAG: hypothetical protein K9M75_08935 [Phycisphaerae bacterium]|nr:hypothetical protein [Phycisphaerae bacterium]
MKKYLYVWLLPFVWGACSLLSLQFPGDEYALYAISSMAGTWIAFVINLQGHPNDAVFWLSITITGMSVMALLGLWLKFIKLKPWVWLCIYIIAAIIICITTIFSYPSLEKALSKNGSYWAYIFSSLNMAMYASVILGSIAAGIKKTANKISAKKEIE